VAEKDSANFCEYFDFQSREWRADGGAGDAREDKARADLKRLFGED
jgi:hypothetical protein